MTAYRPVPDARTLRRLVAGDYRRHGARPSNPAFQAMAVFSLGQSHCPNWMQQVDRTVLQSDAAAHLGDRLLLEPGPLDMNKLSAPLGRLTELVTSVRARYNSVQPDPVGLS